MDHDDIEGEAGAIIRAAGLDDEEPTDMRALCIATTGSAPEFARLTTEASSAIINGRARVFVRRGTSPARARWLVGHELAEIHLAARGYSEPDIEHVCDAMGAALAVPRRAYLRARQIHGDAHREIAIALGTTESVALLREGEATGRPVSVIRAAGAIVRGEPFVWPVRLELRRAKRARHESIERSAIRDEGDRVGLRAVVGF